MALMTMIRRVVYGAMVMSVVGGVGEGLLKAAEEKKGWMIELRERLPDQIETWMESEGPIRLRAKSSDGRASRPSFQQALQELPLWLFLQADQEAFREVVERHGIRRASEGSFGYRAPRAEGVLRYQGFAVLEFDESAHGELEQAFREEERRATRTVPMRSSVILAFESSADQEERRFYFALVQPGYLLVANDEALLKEVLERLDLPQAKDARVASFGSLWKLVDKTASFWAMRRYESKGADEDPSSPLGTNRAASVEDPDARGFSFSYDGEWARAKYVSGSSNNLEKLAAGWPRPAAEFGLTIERMESEVVGLSFRAAPDETSGRVRALLFSLLGYLGHAIFL